MKKVSLVMALVAALVTAKAQEGQNAVKINPLSLFLATGNVSYERATTENQSCDLGLFY
jgi:hypothetical protein